MHLTGEENEEVDPSKDLKQQFLTRSNANFGCDGKKEDSDHREVVRDVPMAFVEGPALAKNDDKEKSESREEFGAVKKFKNKL
jgi:hypothetical protein